MTEIADKKWMRRALRLAALGRHASPNPMVGCVIVSSDGIKVGEGFHVQPGQLHAERVALAYAGRNATGGIVYVTLEPCSHFGRTPPCVDALIEAQVQRIFVAMVDPDRRVAGRGIEKLLSAGIDVSVGLLGNDARALNRAYIHHRTTGLPWVTVKVATTLDGKIASAGGDSKWITGSITRNWVHRQLRDRSDAILVGVNTVIADNPLLTTRLANGRGRDPLRIILDSSLRTPLGSNVVKQSPLDGKTYIACLAERAREREAEFAARGVVLIPISPDNRGRVDIGELLMTLGTKHDVSSVLIEGGGGVIASAIENRLVNRYIATIAPKLIGGNIAPGPIGGIGLASTMKEAVQLKRWSARRSAGDLVIDALLTEP